MKMKTFVLHKAIKKATKRLTAHYFFVKDTWGDTILLTPSKAFARLVAEKAGQPEGTVKKHGIFWLVEDLNF